jgi:N-acyl-D-aspartate/D-glutamate deacylase
MDLIIRPGKVIDCTGRAPQESTEVVVSGGTIAAVRPVASAPVPDGAEVLTAA